MSFEYFLSSSTYDTMNDTCELCNPLHAPKPSDLPDYLFRHSIKLQALRSNAKGRRSFCKIIWDGLVAIYGTNIPAHLELDGWGI